MAAVNVEELEVVPGFEHQNLQGQVFAAVNEEELRDALEKAFDYRGDVTITLKSGGVIEGYLFDRRSAATLAESRVRIMPKSQPGKISVAYSEIAALAFTGRDTAAGKSWEAWVRKYWEKKKAGETNIELKPEHID